MTGGDERGGILFMATTMCPICGTGAQRELPRTGEFDVIHCPKHGEFEVSDTAIAPLVMVFWRSIPFESSSPSVA
jgi:hypothetical protein